MKNFKVGDKVRVMTTQDSYQKHLVGEEGIITKIDGRLHELDIDNIGFYANELELVGDTPKLRAEENIALTKVESLKFKDEAEWNVEATVDELVRDFSDLIDNVSVITGDSEAELMSSPMLTVGELEKLIEDWIVPNLITLSSHIRKNTELK